MFAEVVLARSSTACIGVFNLVTSAPVLCLDVALIATESLIVYPFVSPIVEIAAPSLSFEEPVSN